MSEGTIPPPSEADCAIDLAREYRRFDAFVTGYGGLMSSPNAEMICSLARLCHAFVTERDRLRAELRDYKAAAEVEAGFADELNRDVAELIAERDAAVERAAAMRERCAKVADKFADDAEKRTRVHERDDHDCVLGYLVSSNIAAAIRSIDDPEPAPKETE